MPSKSEFRFHLTKMSQPLVSGAVVVVEGCKLYTLHQTPENTVLGNYFLLEKSEQGGCRVLNTIVVFVTDIGCNKLQEQKMISKS